MTVDIRVIRAGQMYRYYLRVTVVGDGRRPAHTSLRAAQEQACVPVGRWMGRGLAALGLTPGQEVTEAQLRNLFGERDRHPDADRIEADRLAQGDSPKKAFKAGVLGRRGRGTKYAERPRTTSWQAGAWSTPPGVPSVPATPCWQACTSRTPWRSAPGSAIRTSSVKPVRVSRVRPGRRISD
ncbi:relaxase domain-containing protein [Streptomyces sp. NBC_00199]|uniref:relaxase domain-containing protein n=1 Tax=Streptomyces sp. NBC_00199 TaxID=2975678 RepID=UPI00225003E7|nr:relaxase domain-containing protein [Streptomyces sp. NBC_00199]MCX5269382.1 relaxase domain-containing protein [Streptomyces sp. NBC_00199]